MSLLPKNEPMEKDVTPKIFFIWGQSMHGKTYLAKQFPNSLILNTDGNGKKIDTPHKDIYDFETFVNVLREIEQGKHTFETIIIDLVDDIKTFMDEYICKRYEEENASKGITVDSIADIPFGKGFNESKSIWKRLMIRLSQLPYTVVFISHIVQVTDEYDKSVTIEQPSLEQKYLNMTKGRTDVMIKCQKIGKNYLQICNEKRDIYKKSDFKNDKILFALKDVKQLFEDNKPVIQELTKTEDKKTLKPLKKEVKEVEEETDELLNLPVNGQDKSEAVADEEQLQLEINETIISDEPVQVSENIEVVKPLKKKKSLLISNEEE